MSKDEYAAGRVATEAEMLAVADLVAETECADGFTDQCIIVAVAGEPFF